MPLGGGGSGQPTWGSRTERLSGGGGRFSTARGRGSAERAIHHLNQPHYRCRGGGQPLTWRQQRPRKRPTAAQGTSRASAGSDGEGLGGTAPGGLRTPSPPPPPSQTKRNRGETPPRLEFGHSPMDAWASPSSSDGSGTSRPSLTRPPQTQSRVHLLLDTCHWIPCCRLGTCNQEEGCAKMKHAE